MYGTCGRIDTHDRRRRRRTIRGRIDTRAHTRARRPKCIDPRENDDFDTRARSAPGTRGLRGRPINVTLHVASVRHTHYAPMCLQEHSCRGVMKRVLCEPAHDDEPSTPENSFVFGTGFGRAVGERLVLCNRLRAFVLQVSTNALQWHIDKVSIMTPTLG